MHLSVGRGGVTVRTLDGAETEAKVPLPDRWIRSFAESQVIASRSMLRAEPDPSEVRRLVRDLPRTTPTGSVAWVQPAARGLRLASRPGAGAVGLAGAERLRVIEPYLRDVTGVRVFAGESASSFWEFTTPRGRLTVGFSPQKSRGFSGEGGLLEELTSPGSDLAADAILEQLAFDSRLEPVALMARTGLSAAAVVTGISVLAAHGLVGYDGGNGSWFHRPLPYDRSLTESLHPRLASANAIVADVIASGDGSFQVGGYRVRLGTAAGDTCTCAWWGKHRGERGPCKHVLAARMASA
jgi:hypothetical protein